MVLKVKDRIVVLMPPKGWVKNRKKDHKRLAIEAIYLLIMYFALLYCFPLFMGMLYAIVAFALVVMIVEPIQYHFRKKKNN